MAEVQGRFVPGRSWTIMTAGRIPNGLADLLSFDLPSKTFPPNLASFLLSVLHSGSHLNRDLMALPASSGSLPVFLVACFSRGPSQHTHLLGGFCPLFH